MMDSAQFLSHYGLALPDDIYLEKGELTDPVGLYAVREYPPNAGMPKEYLGLIHLGHYDGDVFCTINVHKKREFHNVSHNEEIAIRRKLPTNRPLDIRIEGGFRLSDDEQSILDSKGMAIDVSVFIEDQWKLHLAPFSGFRFWPHLFKRAFFKGISLTLKGVLYAVRLVLKLSFLVDMKIRIPLSPWYDDSTDYKENPNNYPSLAQETEKLQPLSLGITIQKASLLIWAVLIVTAYFFRENFPSRLQGIMSKPLSSAALGIITISFVDRVLVPILRWAFEKPLLNLHRFVHQAVFRSYFGGTRIRTIGSFYL